MKKIYIPTEDELMQMGFIPILNKRKDKVEWKHKTSVFWVYWGEEPSWCIRMTGIYPESRNDLETIIRALIP